MNMKMKIDPLTKSYHGYNLKGSKALELIMDNKTPKIDLLVRESIQNSADATLDDARCCRIKFDLKQFSNNKFASFFEDYDKRFMEEFGDSMPKALIISDYRTTGLLGKPYEDPHHPNNLYKLVYAFLESDKGENSGGSWGIGKSVYYRYGSGVVFYYTCTYEDGFYNHKLVGAMLEDEQAPDKIINDVEKYLGVAFIGKYGRGEDGSFQSLPITDSHSISEFLSVFGLSLYPEGETGTVIIIPYFEPDNLLGDKMYEGKATWDDDFYETLKMSIQRWYFPRIGNTLINKYIEVFVNGERVELIPFFKTLQELFNGTLPDVNKYQIKAPNFDSGANILGTFNYKKFTKQELDVLVAPNWYPSPYSLLDIRNDENGSSNDSIIFYTRKPKMIVTYDDSRKFTSLESGPNEYIIGVFKLNDYAKSHGSYLGEYFKESETANHKGWEDIKESKKAPGITLLSKKPFSTIRKEIGKELSSKFSVQIIEEKLTQNTRLQRDLGELLLPPEDFGKDKDPSPRRGRKGSKDPLKSLKKEKCVTIVDTGFINGKPTYTFQLYLKPNDVFELKTNVHTSSKKYTFDEWDEMDLVLPCYIKTLEVDKYVAFTSEFNYTAKRDFDDEKINGNIIKKDGVGELIFTVEKIETKYSKKVYGFRVSNKTEGILKINIDISLQPIDETSSFGFSHEITNTGGEQNG